MDFNAATAYLLSLGNEVETMKLGLVNINTLLAALGDPQNNYLKVQVAGTNGKGSVCAFLDSICIEAGIRTGCYTSPHLISVTERIKISGIDISEEDFAKHASKVRETAELLISQHTIETVPTFFEQVTAVALLAFAEARVGLAILETGLGGRFDATTAANAEIAVITRIDLDHQEYLGETVEKIAAEKAAIIREDSSGVVIGPQTPEVLKVISNRCAELGITPSNEMYSPWKVMPLDSGKTRVETTRHIFENVELGLKGRHQAENAQIAIRAVQSLRYDFAVNIDDVHILEGLEKAVHPGRLEYIDNFLLDGAHNPAGARALRSFLDEFVHQRITMIFGAMNDKDVASMAEILWSKADWLILTRGQNTRASSADELAAFLPPSFDKRRLVHTDSVRAAMAETQNGIPDGLVVVTGSLYLVGEVKKLLAENPELGFAI